MKIHLDADSQASGLAQHIIDAALCGLNDHARGFLTQMRISLIDWYNLSLDHALAIRDCYEEDSLARQILQERWNEAAERQGSVQCAARYSAGMSSTMRTHDAAV